MKKLIKKLLKEITDSRLLNEQTNITVNTLDANNRCHTPILRTCSEDVNQQPYVGGFICRVYQSGCLMKNMSTPYQIGDCFRWDDQANLKVECIMGFASQKANRLVRVEKNCVDCTTDANNNGVPDCIDCDGMTWSGGGWKCNNGQPNYNCSAMPATGMGSYNPLNPAPNTYANILDCQASCIPPVIPGCMDSTACNYDPTATTDDGSCTYPGCQDPNAVNNGYQCNGTQGNVGCSGNCCIPTTYDCIPSGPSTVGGCVAVSSGQGQFNSEADCLNSPECGRFYCSKNAKSDWGVIGQQSCRKCKPWMATNGVWPSSCKYLDNTCNNECGPMAIDDKVLAAPADCSVEQHDDCWVCHWDANNDDPAGPQSCIQLGNLPSGWVNNVGNPQGFNYYNTEVDCMSAGPECIRPKGGPQKEVPVNMAEEIKRMGRLIKY